MGKCQLTGALEPLLEWSRTGSEENVSAVPPSPDRNPRRAIAEFWRRPEGSGGGLGLRQGRMADDLDPVSELHTLDQFWQLVVAVDPTPTLLGALDQLEDHGERGLVRQTAF
jgi:hypothetical protein